LKSIFEVKHLKDHALFLNTQCKSSLQCFPTLNLIILL
jgi:hypothetical protein